jgi:hypothetical protein
MGQPQGVAALLPERYPGLLVRAELAHMAQRLHSPAR